MVAGRSLPLNTVRLKELLVVARHLETNAAILKTLLTRICLSRYLSVYHAVLILDFAWPCSPKQFYIPDFMNFFPTNGEVTCQMAMPLIKTISPRWIELPSTTETAIRLMIDLYYYFDTRNRMMDYIQAVERDEKRART